MKMNPVVHFEMPNYVVVSTTERDPKTKFPKEPGRINGGFFQKTNDNQHPSVVIAVDNIREHMKKVEKAGGKVLGDDPHKPGEPCDIPGVGLYCRFIDTEGNMVSMIQPYPMKR